VPAAVLGSTGGSRIVIRVSGTSAVDLALAEAEQAWTTGLENHFARRVA
jgi:hypothetical protein